MRKPRAELMYEKFELYNPGLAKYVEYYEQLDTHRLLITLDNDIKYIYHFISNTCRRVIEHDGSIESSKRELAIRLAEIMSEKGIDRKTLSEATGISEVSIGCYLNEKKIPSYHNARQLAKALRCSVSDFMD